MEARELVKQYLEHNHVLELATIVDGKPHMSTVHCAFDEEFNIYWLSSRFSAHSKALEVTPFAAVGVLENADARQCLHIEGQSFEIKNPDEITKAHQAYSQRFGENPARLKQVLAKNEEAGAYYTLKADSIVLFDAKNFPDNPRQIVK